MNNRRIRVSEKEYNQIKQQRINQKNNNEENKNVLVIPDLHLPFTHPLALEFCKNIYKEYNCNKVIFLGDILDNSQTTRWELNPDAKNAKDELKESIELIKLWYNEFNEATCLTGNHENRIIKKLKRGGVSQVWLKDFNEVLNVPKWNFVNEYIYNNIKYIHGEGCSSTLQSLLQSNTSIVFGHFHSKFEIIYNQNKFAMCCGWLGNIDDIAFEYARTFIKRPILGCGIIQNHLPLLIPMTL
jgi:metallophosphoesterase superfamily enzyme